MKKELLNVKVVGRGCDKYFELLGIVQKAVPRPVLTTSQKRAQRLPSRK